MKFVCWIAFGSIKSVGNNKYTWNPKQPLFFGWFGETPIVHVMIWNHPIETILKINYLFGKQIQKWKPQVTVVRFESLHPYFASGIL